MGERQEMCGARERGQAAILLERFLGVLPPIGVDFTQQFRGGLVIGRSRRSVSADSGRSFLRRRLHRPKLEKSDWSSRRGRKLCQARIGPFQLRVTAGQLLQMWRAHRFVEGKLRGSPRPSAICMPRSASQSRSRLSQPPVKIRMSVRTPIETLNFGFAFAGSMHDMRDEAAFLRIINSEDAVGPASGDPAAVGRPGDAAQSGGRSGEGTDLLAALQVDQTGLPILRHEGEEFPIGGLRARSKTWSGASVVVRMLPSCGGEAGRSSAPKSLLEPSQTWIEPFSPPR